MRGEFRRLKRVAAYFGTLDWLERDWGDRRTFPKNQMHGAHSAVRRRLGRAPGSVLEPGDAARLNECRCGSGGETKEFSNHGSCAGSRKNGTAAIRNDLALLAFFRLPAQLTLARRWTNLRPDSWAKTETQPSERRKKEF